MLNTTLQRHGALCYKVSMPYEHKFSILNSPCGNGSFYPSHGRFLSVRTAARQSGGDLVRDLFYPVAKTSLTASGAQALWRSDCLYFPGRAAAARGGLEMDGESQNG